MTKKEELIWRLKDRPTVSEITELVKDKIITNEEARTLLFNKEEPTEDTELVGSLKKQIKFLEELVKELSQNRNTTYIERWVKTYTQPWPQTIFTYTSGIGGQTSTTGNVIGSSTALHYAQNLLES